MPSHGETAEPAVPHGKPQFCGSWHPWTTGPVGGGAVLPCAPRLEAAGLVRGRCTVWWPQLRTARFQQNGPCMHRCRIQLARACAIDASRAELSIGPWVGGVSVAACPSFSRLKSAGQSQSTEIRRSDSINITPTESSPRHPPGFFAACCAGLAGHSKAQICALELRPPGCCGGRRFLRRTAKPPHRIPAGERGGPRQTD